MYIECMCVCIHAHVQSCLRVFVIVHFPSLPTDEPPTLPDLLDVPQAVGARYLKFGIFLLNDKTGSQMEVIENDCHGESEKITFQILREWLKGSGLAVTWKTLVEALRKAKINTFADKIAAEKRL